MLDPRGECFSCWESMMLIPFYGLVGKGEDGPWVPKLHEEVNDCIVLYILGGSSCRVRICPKVPVCGTPKKRFLWGTRKRRDKKIKQKSIHWTILFYFQENRLPRKNTYLPKNALLFFFGKS